MTTSRRILGVDPGTLKMGYAFVEVNGRSASAVEYGVFLAPKDRPIEERLLSLYRSLTEKFSLLKPDECVVEDVFFGKNFKSAVRIGEARSIAMLVAAENECKVYSYPPARIKQAVVGNGRASKQQVQGMVKRILGLSSIPEEDASDALAAVICHWTSARLIP